MQQQTLYSSVPFNLLNRWVSLPKLQHHRKTLHPSPRNLRQNHMLPNVVHGSVPAYYKLPAHHLNGLWNSVGISFACSEHSRVAASCGRRRTPQTCWRVLSRTLCDCLECYTCGSFYAEGRGSPEGVERIVRRLRSEWTRCRGLKR